MVFVNKSLLYTYKFTATNTLLFFQFIFQVILIRGLNCCGVIHTEPFTIARAKIFSPISFFYCANTSVALVALKDMNVAAYSMVKRLTPILVLLIELIIFGKRESFRTCAAVFWMVIGTAIVAQYDERSLLSAYVLGLASCFLQALYLIFVKRTGAESELDSFSILYFHSIMSIPLISILVLVHNEYESARNSLLLGYNDIGFMISLLLSITMGALLNYALFLCTQVTTPITTLLSGHVKSFAQIFIGLFTFEGVELTMGFLIGLILSMGGAVLYIHEKYDTVKKSELQKNNPS